MAISKEEYETKLVELNGKLNTLTPQKILNDNAIKQSEELFMSQFGTTDIAVLEAKLTEYETGVAVKTQELAELEEAEWDAFNNMIQEEIDKMEVSYENWTIDVGCHCGDLTEEEELELIRKERKEARIAELEAELAQLR